MSTEKAGLFPGRNQNEGLYHLPPEWTFDPRMASRLAGEPGWVCSVRQKGVHRT